MERLDLLMLFFFNDGMSSGVVFLRTALVMGMFVRFEF